jgi:transposase
MFLAALLMSAAPVALAPDPRPITTIIIDQRTQCGIGRIAYDQRAKSVRTARQLKQSLEARGKRVRLVTLRPGVVLDHVPGPLVINPAC